jgi:glycosyltransferase involved in cell wall biosynthesis
MATVIILGSFAPSLVRFRGNLIKDLADRGHRVIAMAPLIDDGVRRRLAALGAAAQDVVIDNQNMNPLHMLKSIRSIRDALRTIAPDVVIAYTIKPVTLGAIAASRCPRTRFVSLITGLGFAFTRGSSLKRVLARAVATVLYRQALKRSDAVVFQNPDDCGEFRERRILPSACEPVIVAGSGVDLAHFAPQPLPQGVRFLMISRLIGDKGVREYGEAARRLKAKYEGVRFSLVGYIEGSPDALTAGELRNIEDGGVEFLGRMDDVRPAIADCSVFVLPSRYREGTPRSILEAMAMGRAIVTTDAPGCRQTVDEGVNGFLVAPGDATSLEAAMERFISERALIAPMGIQSRRIAESRFDVRQVNAQLIAAAGL